MRADRTNKEMGQLERFRIQIFFSVFLIVALIASAVVLTAPEDLPAPAKVQSEQLQILPKPGTRVADPRTAGLAPAQITMFLARLNVLNSSLVSESITEKESIVSRYVELYTWAEDEGIEITGYGNDKNILFTNSTNAQAASFIEIKYLNPLTNEGYPYCAVDNRAIDSSTISDTIPSFSLIAKACSEILANS